MSRTVALLALTMAGCVSMEINAQEELLQFKAEASCEKDKTNIIFFIENKGGTTLKIDEKKSPWSNFSGASLLVTDIETGFETELHNVFSTSNSEITLAPGQKVSEKISLSDLFRPYDESVEKKYVVNWRYRNPFDGNKIFMGGILVVSDECKRSGSG